MKCTVKQYCRYLCRVINSEPATITPHLEALAAPVAELAEATPKKGVYLDRKKTRFTAQKATIKH